MQSYIVTDSENHRTSDVLPLFWPENLLPLLYGIYKLFDAFLALTASLKHLALYIS